MIKKRHDVDQHLQAASKLFFCHRATLCDRKVSIGKRLRYFDAVISPVAVMVESMNLRPFMASSYGQNVVSSNIGS